MANDNKLKKVKDESTIVSLISSAKDEMAEVFIWRLVGNTKHLGKVRIESVRKMRKDFCITPAEGQDRQVQDLMGTQSYIDLYVPESALLLRCPIKTTDAPYRYYLQLPSFVAQVERRNSFRLNVHDTSDVQISFGKTITDPRKLSQHFVKSCFDISAGGMSFYISRLETKFFNLHDPISTIEIKTRDWSGKVNAEITFIKEVEPDAYNGLPYKVWRVCCRFTQIDQVGRKYLEKFIFERIKEELHAINE